MFEWKNDESDKFECWNHKEFFNAEVGFTIKIFS